MKKRLDNPLKREEERQTSLQPRRQASMQALLRGYNPRLQKHSQIFRHFNQKFKFIYALKPKVFSSLDLGELGFSPIVSLLDSS